MSEAAIKAPEYSTPPCAQTRELVLPEDCAGLRLDQALARCLPEFSRARLQAWVEAGRVLVDGAGARARLRLRGGERVSVSVEPEVAVGEDRPQAMDLSVVHEDGHLLVLDKPAGLVVHPGAGNREGTLLNALLARAPELRLVPRAGIVHRLDRQTSGLMAVARTPEAATALVRQLQARSVSRVYHAVVHGRLTAPGTVDAPVGRHPTQRTRMAVTPRGREARTHYRPLAGGSGWTLVECRLDTGRTHQIRVHMQHLGHPLVGDPVYRGGSRLGSGAAAFAAGDRQSLHAVSLSLDHPSSGERLRWDSALPADLRQLLHILETTCP